MEFRVSPDASSRFANYLARCQSARTISQEAIDLLKDFNFSGHVVEIKGRGFQGGELENFHSRCIQEGFTYISSVKGLLLTDGFSVDVYRAIAERIPNLKPLLFVSSSVRPDDEEQVLQALCRLEKLENIYLYNSMYIFDVSRNFAKTAIEALSRNGENNIKRIGVRWLIRSAQEFRSMFSGFPNLQELDFCMNPVIFQDFLQVFDMIGAMSKLQTVCWMELSVSDLTMTNPERAARVLQAFDKHVHLREFLLVQHTGLQLSLGPMIVKHVESKLKAVGAVLLDTGPTNNLLSDMCWELKWMIAEEIFSI